MLATLQLAAPQLHQPRAVEQAMGSAVAALVVTLRGADQAVRDLEKALAPSFEQHPDAEKLSTYECGFEPFEDARSRFDVRFYLVALLFIIFDLEIAFLFPWAVTLGETGVFGFWSMCVFLGILTVGFIYEWKKGALEWE